MIAEARSHRRPTPARPGWTVAAHTLAAVGLGALEAVRLGGSVARSTVPTFALTGLAIGGVVAATERVAACWPSPGWRATLLEAAPSLLVAAPLSFALSAGELGALPRMAVWPWPWLAPVAVWLVTAAVIAIARGRLADQLARATAIVGLAGAIGALVWLERHVVGPRAPGLHLAATLAVLALAGAALRVAYRGRCGAVVAAVIAALALGTGAAALGHGLRVRHDRQRLAAFGDQGRDLVWMWRQLIDLRPLGGRAVLAGDCDRAEPAPLAPPDRGCDEGSPPPPVAAPPPR
jgi:hypothetical protein